MASEKVTKLIEEVKSLTVLELSELVKALEEEFGVSAAAPVLAASVPGAAAAAAPAEEEKTEFDVVLKRSDPRRSRSSRYRRPVLDSRSKDRWTELPAP